MGDQRANPKVRRGKMTVEKTFEEELTNLINRHSMESCSDTPDFLLVRYLMDCLHAYEATVVDNKYWHGGPNELAALREENERLERVKEAAIELRKWGIVFDDERVRHIEVQIPRVCVEEFDTALSEQEE